MSNIINVKVFSPDQCPFRYWAPYYHQWDVKTDYCSYKRSLDEQAGHGDVSCPCAANNEQWTEGCPLLENGIKIVKN